MEEKIIQFQIGITTNEMKYVLNYLFFYIPQVENGAAEMGEKGNEEIFSFNTESLYCTIGHVSPTA